MKKLRQGFTVRAELLRDRKLYIFLMLIALLALVNARQWGSGSKSVTQAKAARSTAVLPGSTDPVLNSDHLAKEAPHFEEEKRNIFSFFASQPSPSEEEEEVSEEVTPPPPVCGNSVCEEGEDLSACPEDCQPPPPPAPVISLRYIGYMAEEDGSVAFLTDGKEVYMGRVNDVIANQYRILNITEDSVELGLLDSNQSSIIRFQGSQGG